MLSGPSSYATGMNNVGQVVGYADTYTGYSHAFLYTGSGPLVNLGSFGGDYSVSSATGINNLGQIVGYAQAADGTYDGFLYSGNGPMVNLGSTYVPLCINDASQVAAVAGSSNFVGTYVSSGGTGNWVNIGSLGGNETQPCGMNNSGDVVGFSSTSASTELPQAFLYSDGKMTDLGTFGGQLSEATGINDFGVVVGDADFPGDSSANAFVYYDSGAIVDLNSLVDLPLGWTINYAAAINDQGQIAATAYDAQQGQSQAVLLSPTPEPSSICLLGVAILGLITIHAGAASNETAPTRKYENT